MSNYKCSIDGHTLFPIYPLQFSSERIHRKKNHAPRKPSVSYRNTTDFSTLNKTTVDAYSQVSSDMNYSLTSINQRRSLQNTRLIPLKLSSATTIPENNTLVCESTNSSLAIQCRQSPAPTSQATGLSFSEEEIKSVLAGVKLLYLNGNHKRCVMRCRLLLESVKNSFHIDPVYRVYLAYYLASSLEIMAFALPNHSSVKLDLFKEALMHYQSAASELDYALFCIDSVVRNSNTSDASSQLSSARSSVDSVFSQYSKTSSIASVSPLSEDCTLNNFTKQLERSESRRKKVSFSLPLHNQQEVHSKYDDDLQSISTSSLLDSFPIPKLQTSDRRRSSLEPAPLNLSSARSMSPLFKVKSPNSSKLSHLKLYQRTLLGFQSDFDSRIKEINRNIDQIKTNTQNTRIRCDSKSDHSKLPMNRLEISLPRKRFDGSRYQALCDKALSEL